MRRLLVLLCLLIAQPVAAQECHTLYLPMVQVPLYYELDPYPGDPP
jgi:hypothetical protein